MDLEAGWRTQGILIFVGDGTWEPASMRCSRPGKLACRGVIGCGSSVPPEAEDLPYSPLPSECLRSSFGQVYIFGHFMHLDTIGYKVAHVEIPLQEKNPFQWLR
jgi:hypothetical protein